MLGGLYELAFSFALRHRLREFVGRRAQRGNELTAGWRINRSCHGIEGDSDSHARARLIEAGERAKIAGNRRIFAVPLVARFLFGRRR